MVTGTDFEPRRVPILLRRGALFLLLRRGARLFSWAETRAFSPAQRRATFLKRRGARHYTAPRRTPFLMRRGARDFSLAPPRFSNRVRSALFFSTEKNKHLSTRVPAPCLESLGGTYHTPHEEKVTCNLWVTWIIASSQTI